MGVRSPLAWPRMWSLLLYPPGHPLVLLEKPPAGFSKSLSVFQVLGCAHLVQAELTAWCHQISLGGSTAVWHLRSAWCQQQVLMCVVWGRVCLSSPELSVASGSCLPAERGEDVLESSVSSPRWAGALELPCSWTARLSGTRCFLWIDLSAQHGGACCLVLGEPPRRLLRCISLAIICTGSS